MKKPTFAEIAVERAARMAKQSGKPIPITKEKTFEQIVEDQSREGMAWLQVFQALHFLEENPLVNVSPNALDFVRVVRELARNGQMRDDITDVLQPIDGLLPKGALGEVMSTGRKVGTLGKVRAWVRKYMVKYPAAMPAQAWEAFKKRPPKGCTVYENRLGKYIETEGAPDTSRAWFGTIVGQERPKKQV